MVFQGLYGFSTGAAGLTFLGLGAGCIAGVVIIGGMSDKVYLHYAGNNGGEGKPEYRLPIMVVCSLFCPIGLFWYGWSAQAHAHFIVPIIGSAFMAFGMMSVMVCPLFPSSNTSLTKHSCQYKTTSSTPTRNTPPPPSQQQQSCVPFSAHSYRWLDNQCTISSGWDGEIACLRSLRWRSRLCRFSFGGMASESGRGIR